MNILDFVLHAWFNGKGLIPVTQGHGLKSFWSHTMLYHATRRALTLLHTRSNLVLKVAL